MMHFVVTPRTFHAANIDSIIGVLAVKNKAFIKDAAKALRGPVTEALEAHYDAKGYTVEVGFPYELDWDYMEISARLFNEDGDEEGTDLIVITKAPLYK